MSDFLAAQQYERAMLRDALVARGFTDDSNALYGDVSWHPTSDGVVRRTAVRIELGDAFPFGPPAVFLNARLARPSDPTPTFHLETSGALCLYDRDVEVSDASWRDPDRLLDQIAGWLEGTFDGWPGDTDTDLERYLPPDGGFLRYDADELDGRTGVLRLDGGRVRWFELPRKPATPAKRRRKGKASRSARRAVHVPSPAAYLLDVGELSAPVRTWPELLALAGTSAHPFQRLVRLGTVRLALVRYTRSGQAGVLALALRPSAQAPGGVALAALEAADVSLASRQLRAGAAASSLGTMRVAVVGCGAIGSYVADLLLRSGVRRLHLLDHQRLRPGNVVRHLAGDRYVGWAKTDAVRACLSATGLPIDGVSAEHTLITTARQACDLVRDQELVIDATGDQRAAALLQAAAQDVGAFLIKVCLQRQGGIVRVDRFPLLPGESHALTVPVLPGLAPLRERGCGDAVSLTPPHAVTTAAAAAVRIVVAQLTGASSHPSHVEVLVAQPDTLYQQLGLVGLSPNPNAHIGVVSSPGAAIAEQDRQVVRLDPQDPVGLPHIPRARPPVAPATPRVRQQREGR